MSMTYIRHHDENIKDIEAFISPEEVKYSALYKSKFTKDVVDFYRKQKVVKQEKGKQLFFEAKKEANKSMGYARKEIWPVPTAFLRKGEGVKVQKFSDHECYRRHVPIVPRLGVKKKCVEKKSEDVLVVEKPKQTRDFIQKNIEKIKELKQVIRQPRYVDTKDGGARLLLPSGLIPVHSCAPSFGKKPCYLKVNRQLAKKISAECKMQQADEYQFCEDLIKQGTREIPREELLALTRGLQTNWDHHMNTYNKLPLFTDTEPKKIRKRNLESVLHTIESYMAMIENNTRLFVSDHA